MPRARAGRDGRTGAGDPRDEREALDQADDEAVDRGHGAFPSDCAPAFERRGPFSDHHDDAPQHQGSGNHPETPQRARDEIAKDEPCDTHRDRADHDRPGQPVIGIPAPLWSSQPTEPRLANLHNVREEVDQGGGDRAQLDDRGVGGHGGIVDLEAEHLLGDGQVARRGDREVLGQPFHDAEDDGVEVAQVSHASQTFWVETQWSSLSRRRSAPARVIARASLRGARVQLREHGQGRRCLPAGHPAPGRHRERGHADVLVAAEALCHPLRRPEERRLIDELDRDGLRRLAVVTAQVEVLDPASLLSKPIRQASWLKFCSREPIPPM